MTFCMLAVCGLAAMELLELWRHGSLFARWRARVDLMEGWFAELLRCGLCLGPWLSLGLVGAVVGLNMADSRLPAWVSEIARLPIEALAVAGLAGLLHDFARACRGNPTLERMTDGTSETRL